MRIRLGALVLLLSGCASWPGAVRPSNVLLAKADGFLERGDYENALRAYDEVLRTYPDDDAAARAKLSRPPLAALMATREEMARLRREIAEREVKIERLSGEVAARDAELSRTRQDLAARQAEVTRLMLEAEKMNADLESLKRIEMRLERRQR